MNTNPAEETLALWVEDELHGPELAAVDAWAAGRPEWLAHREDARKVKALFRRAELSAAEEPPYPDFFNTKIAQAISATPAASVPAPKPLNWFRWFMPAAVAAAMALCFWAGTHITPSPAGPGGSATPVASASAEPFLYVPERGVQAAYFTSAVADAGVIVLDGVAAIPDSFELPETAVFREQPPATAGKDEFR